MKQRKPVSKWTLEEKRRRITAIAEIYRGWEKLARIDLNPNNMTDPDDMADTAELLEQVATDMAFRVAKRRQASTTPSIRREKLQLDKSLYGKLNAATQKAVDEINAEAQRVLPDALWQREWGSQTTLRMKREYLIRFKRRQA